MEEALIKIFPQLGVASASIAALVVVTKLHITSQQELMKAHLEERTENQRVYREFVESNNHKMTDLIVSSSESINQSTQFMKVAVDTLGDLRDELRSFLRNKNT